MEPDDVVAALMRDKAFLLSFAAFFSSASFPGSSLMSDASIVPGVVPRGFFSPCRIFGFEWCRLQLGGHLGISRRVNFHVEEMVKWLHSAEMKRDDAVDLWVPGKYA